MTDIEKYIKNVKTIMPIHSKREKEYLLKLNMYLQEFIDENPDYLYSNIVEQFGEPKDIVVEYINTVDENHLIKSMKTRTLIYRFVIFLSLIGLVLATWFAVLWYQLYQEDKNSIIYEIETTITEE